MKEALGHATVSVTEVFLEGLGAIGRLQHIGRRNEVLCELVLRPSQRQGSEKWIVLTLRSNRYFARSFIFLLYLLKTAMEWGYAGRESI